MQPLGHFLSSNLTPLPVAGALICQNLGITPEALANEWEAFAMNRNYEDITLKRLDKLSDSLGKVSLELSGLAMLMLS